LLDYFTGQTPLLVIHWFHIVYKGNQQRLLEWRPGSKRLSTDFVIFFIYIIHRIKKELKTENIMYVPYNIYHTLHTLICLRDHTHAVIATTLFYI